MICMHRATALLSIIFAATNVSGRASAAQPKVAPGPGGEPDWSYLLKQQWGLDINRDLRNPPLEGAEPAALFRRADASKPVTFTPIIALGLETPTSGGWYAVDPRTLTLAKGGEHGIWTYTHKQPAEEIKSGQYTPPRLERGLAHFDPGDAVFGLWVSNEQFKGESVFTQPAMVTRLNERLRQQPYKTMIYPNRHPKTGEFIANSYIIGWEYSTNDDFQDVVTRVDNVLLIPSKQPMQSITGERPQMKKVAGGYQFTEGPAWDAAHEALYFTDIPASQILRVLEGKTEVARTGTGEANGLMFDRAGRLLCCEGGARRLSRGAPGGEFRTVVSESEGKKLNSPNDLWIDATGGIYFTDPRYGNRDDLELDKEAVYYVTADGGSITRLVDNLVRPNGIALSPDGAFLYVVDNGAHSLHRYAIKAPGKLGKGERIAWVYQPDGMSVDRAGRLYVTGEGGVWVLKPDGQWLGLIETPEHPSNCTFGGRDLEVLFITAQKSLYAITTRTRGWHVHLDGPPKK